MTKFQPFPTEEEYVAQMDEGKLLNPRIDSTFKALFTQPTKESRAALKSFLEAATEFQASRHPAAKEWQSRKRKTTS